MNDQDKKPQNSEEEFEFRPIDIKYQAGQEGRGEDDEPISNDEFKFVQEDKSLHDTKFTTKPTTFFKDAMHRFSKNHSSVVGGVILGVLFLLAIILPIDGVVPYDLKLTPSGVAVSSYEQHLPSKITNAGSGFWDGTQTFKNQPYPYDENNNYIGTDPDDSAIVSITDKKSGYASSNISLANAKGGYMVLSSEITEAVQTRSTYAYAYNFVLSSDYDFTLSYSLGWNKDAGYEMPSYSVFMKYNDEYHNITERTTALGTMSTDPLADGQEVTGYSTQTVNFSEYLRTTFPSTTTFNQVNIGIIFDTSTTSSTALYVKDFVFSADHTDKLTSRVKRDLKLRSFGDAKTFGDDSVFGDANTCVGQTKNNSDASANLSYWATNTKPSLADLKTDTCTILKDMYQLTYGPRKNINIPKKTFDNWISKGYINWDYANPTLNKSIMTEAGEKSGEVYVLSVQNVNTSSDADKTNMVCTVLTYKWLGYDTMPMHVFGTDNLGKDILKYTFSGLRTSLLLGIIVSAINILIGVIWGSITGYFGGLLDISMERIVDVLSGIPWIVLMTVLAVKFGSNFWVFALALCLTGWIGTESITRSQFYRYRDREYVLAARTLGAKAPRLIFKHILPNAIGTIITSSVLMIPSVIFSEATISYLNLGLQGVDSLGVILSTNQKYLGSYPVELLIPSIIISLLMICFNLFGNGLRDAFNPSLKGDE